jgi:uncharacterized repeat protein (TIGR03803 family)
VTRRILSYSNLLAAVLFGAAAILMFIDSALASGPHERVIYSFQDSNGTHPDGENATTGLVADQAGNLYGTTRAGGTVAACSCGTVYELSPPATKGGAWTETVLYSFLGGSNDGATPSGTLIFDRAGNLYGTTLGGGSNNTGTVFKLSPPATQGGSWTETVLFIFPADGSHGSWTQGKLAFDGVGNLYGTTEFGGSGATPNCDVGGCGTVFQLSPPATQGGAWTESVLYNFGVVSLDGILPWGVIFRNGVLYGETQGGGTGSNGTVFLLVRKNGNWSEAVLYNFTGSEGSGPVGGLISDSAGNLYGTTHAGGNSYCIAGCGTVFELSPPAVSGNPWQLTTLYSFTGGTDGAQPQAAVVRDTSGNLYGTASVGGLKNQYTNNNGTVFKLSPPAVAGGAWTETVLHAFGGTVVGDGTLPVSELILVKGAYFGTTYLGGSLNSGTVFSVVP